MGRIRSVKPELQQQPWFATLTDAAARTYFGLLGVVDDFGRCAADPLFIGGQIFWGRQRSAAAIGRQLAELEAAGIIRRYKARGGMYLEIVGWADKGSALYQQVNKPQGERFPAPDSNYDRNDSGPGTVRETGPDLDRERDNERETEMDPKASPSRQPEAQKADREPELQPRTISPSSGPGSEHAYHGGGPKPKLDQIVQSAPELVDRDPKPHNVPQEAPGPLLPSSQARAATRRRVIAIAWQEGGNAFRALGRQGIDPTAPDAWAGMPPAESPAMQLLIAQVDRLLIGDEPNADTALAVIKRRIAVAVAEARVSSPPTRRWLTPMRIWHADSFAKAAEISPEQVRPRAGPTSSAGRAPEEPRKIPTLNKNRSTTPP